MTEARTARKRFTYANVPLRRDHLRQPALLDPWNMGKEKTYPLPLVVPGEEARIVDADYHWEVFNGRRGIVTDYSYFTGHHTVAVEGAIRAGKPITIERDFLGREITKG
jgi:hypothetical protein